MSHTRICCCNPEDCYYKAVRCSCMQHGEEFVYVPCAMVDEHPNSPDPIFFAINDVCYEVSTSSDTVTEPPAKPVNINNDFASCAACCEEECGCDAGSCTGIWEQSSLLVSAHIYGAKRITTKYDTGSSVCQDFPGDSGDCELPDPPTCGGCVLTIREAYFNARLRFTDVSAPYLDCVGGLPRWQTTATVEMWGTPTSQVAGDIDCVDLPDALTIIQCGTAGAIFGASGPWASVTAQVTVQLIAGPTWRTTVVSGAKSWSFDIPAGSPCDTPASLDGTVEENTTDSQSDVDQCGENCFRCVKTTSVLFEEASITPVNLLCE